MRAFQPNSRSAFDVSSMRRGWPSGFVGSQTISPSKRQSRATSGTRSRIVISNPAPRFTGSLFS